MTNNQHFELLKLKDYLYVIKENISDVHPVYTNDPLNIYLIIGDHSALLLDTGCGLYPIKPVINALIANRKLIVINTHTHWDHVLGNVEFDEVYVHEKEVGRVSYPYDVSYFRDSPNQIVEKYAKQNFLIPPAKVIKTLRDKDEFDLGGQKVKIIHCPGHSPGSICLLTSNNELFTSDVAYYGDQFLPQIEDVPQVLSTLLKLIELCKKLEISEVFPSHRKSPCDTTLLIELYDGIENIKNQWDKKESFDFFHAWMIEDNSGKFRYYVSRS